MRLESRKLLEDVRQAAELILLTKLDAATASRISQ